MATATASLTIEAMARLRRFIGPSQMKATICGMMGEEGDFFRTKLAELDAQIQAMPKTYEQDGAGMKAIAHLHYFTGGSDWYITEQDMEPVQHQAFGLADLYGDGGELGYISIVELIRNGAELDYHWTPKPLDQIKRD